MSVRTMARVWDLSQNKGNDLLMLLAIADFADDEGNAYPAVSTLAAKCRMKPRNANLILATLKASGELEVRQNEGPNGTNRYRIVLPCQPLQVSTGVQKPTALQKSTSPPVETYPKPLQVSTDKPSVNHQEPSKGPSKFDPVDWLLKHGVSSDHIRDWLTVRKTRKAANTETAFSRVLNQANLAGLSLDKVVQIMAENSWRGFEAEWLKGQKTPSPSVSEHESPGIGQTRTRGGRMEVFSENMGWVPA